MNNHKKDNMSEEYEDEKGINTELESPINLTISNMTVIDLEPLTWNNYEILPEKFKLKNTGRTVVANGRWLEELPYLTGGPLSNNYNFAQFHFHWGLNEMVGSEHYVDGASYAMELHVVHFDNRFINQKVARQKEDGIAIVVYLFKLQSSINEILDNVIQSLPSIKRSNSSICIAPELLNKLIRPFSQNYFFYYGSLIEQYNHCKVLWLVSRVPIGISIEQVAEFRKLNNTDSKPILKNCKPLKNGQNVKVYHVNPSGSTHSSLLPIFQD